MAISDAQRFELHVGQKASEVTGWSDVVRVHDLDQFKSPVDMRFE